MATPESQAMDSAVLESAFDYAFRSEKFTQGVVIIRNGLLVAERYADERDANSYATSWSAAKSFTSALIGIAVRDGLIDDINVSMGEFISEWSGTEHANITLRHVLMMSSGLDWNESYDVSSGISDAIQMIVLTEDQLDFVISRPILHPPGTVFNYSSGETLLMSAVLETVTGMSVNDYAEQVLFAPLGMTPAQWWQDGVGRTTVYCCIDTTSRQFARFGLLYARNGQWNGQQIVPSLWVADSTRPNDVFEGYGYQWWLSKSLGEEHSYFSARGHDGQYIYVFPQHDLVVVRNGWYDKFEGEPVADPYLYARLPTGGRVPMLGTIPPDSWSDVEFLTPIIQSMGHQGGLASD
ncbi:MAG: beta-lactamase family protein [Gammaproteobacteria bacterium]|nr:beta-lactamase family protein [Gammaproteobacteria bacterium]